MNTIKLAALGCATAIALVTPAMADAFDQAIMKLKCGIISPPCLYENKGNGQVVGIPADAYHINRLINGDWYMLDVNQKAVINNLLVFYTTANCSGQPYFDNNTQALPLVEYDGSAIWVPDTSTTINAQALSYSYGTPPYCTSYPAGPAVLQRAVKGETHTFIGPFMVK